MWRVFDDDPGKVDLPALAASESMSESTLRRYLRNGNRKVSQAGRSTSIPLDHESLLAEVIKKSVAGHQGWSKDMVICGARLTLQMLSENSDPTNRVPAFSHSWLEGFCARHGISA